MKNTMIAIGIYIAVITLVTIALSGCASTPNERRTCATRNEYGYMQVVPCWAKGEAPIPNTSTRSYYTGYGYPNN